MMAEGGCAPGRRRTLTPPLSARSTLLSNSCCQVLTDADWCRQYAGSVLMPCILLRSGQHLAALCMCLLHGDIRPLTGEICPGAGVTSIAVPGQWKLCVCVCVCVLVGAHTNAYKRTQRHTNAHKRTEAELVPWHRGYTCCAGSIGGVVWCALKDKLAGFH